MVAPSAADDDNDAAVSNSSSGGGRLRLVAADGTEVSLSRGAASRSAMLAQLMHEDVVEHPAAIRCGDDASGEHLRLACAYLEGRHDVDLAAWTASLAPDALCGLCGVANFLDVKPLLDAACAELAGRISGRTPAELRELFGIADDLTPDEKRHIAEHHAWAC